MAVMANTRSLIAGLIAGVFLALLVQTLVQPAQLTILYAENQPFGSTPPPDTSTSTSNSTSTAIAMANMLKNTLQIARQAIAGVARSPPAASGYKSARLAVSSSLLHQSTTSSSLQHTSTPSSSSIKHFSTTTSTMASQKSFLQAVKDRRSIYALNKEAPIKDSEIVEIVKQAILHVPSSFNSQSARLVVLLNEEHEKFWGSTAELLKAIVPADQFAPTEQKVNGFKAGYGTILFFEDSVPVQNLQKAFPIYAHHFPNWSEHTSAMHQFALWVALEAEGFGANLQHYNPVVDSKVQETWNIPADWTLRAQLVFGGKAGDAREKEFKPVEGERLFVHGAKN